MSVNTSEEYLDELLQAIEPIISMNDPTPESKIQAEENVEKIVPDEIADLPDADMGLGQAETVEEASTAEVVGDEMALSADEEIPTDTESILAGLLEDEMVPEAEMNTVSEDAVSMDDLLAALTSEESANVEELSVSENDIDVMLSAAENEAKVEAEGTTAYEEDVKELLKQFTDDEDLTDINDILERNDNSEAVDENVLLTPDVEVFQLDEEEVTEEENTKKEKGLFRFFKKKKKKTDKKDKEDLHENVEEKDKEKDKEKDGNVAGTQTNITAETRDAISEGAGSDTSEFDSEELTLQNEEPDLNALFGEGDVFDIEQLLSGGAFEADAGQSSEEVIEEHLGDVKASKKKQKGEKKESFFTRIFNMLTEEEEEEAPKKSNVPEADATGVTDENVAILDELSKEDKKKAKLEKKEKKKKEKEEKKKGKNVAEGEENEEGEDAEKKNKKQKKEKIKKEKPRKVVDLDAKPEKKLSRKKVSIIFVFCFSILAMILILQNVLLDLNNLKEARWAFDNADYETCYANLYGLELSGEDEAIFQKSYVILCVQRKLDSYENFKEMDMGVEALNALFEGVRVYRNMEERAGELNILDRIYEIYQNIYDALSGYGLSDSDIEEILNYESKVTYTKRLDSIVNGTPFEVMEMPVIMQEPDPEEQEPQPLEDVLEQEEDFLPEDTRQVKEQNPVAEANSIKEESEEPQGNVVVVGSNPVDISDATPESENGNGEGTNVGNGDTDLSAPVSGDTVFIN